MSYVPSEPQEEVTTEEKIPSSTPSFLGIGLAVLLATATFLSGLHLGSGTQLEANLFSFFSRQTKAQEQIDLTEFWHVWSLLEEKYVDADTSEQLSVEDRVRGAIDGLVRSYGDPYTTYMPPQEAEMFEEDISGNFSGVGMEVGIRNSVVTVIAPLPDSPAERAGILAGDTIVRIGERSTEGMSTDEAVRLIRGEKDTEVKLTLYREGESEFRDVTIVRDTITIPTSKTAVHGDVFVISLYSFNAISEAEIRSALREFIQSKKQKLVLDLRGNPGGYLQSAVAIASYFLPEGKTVVRESFGEGAREKTYRTSGRAIGTFTPDRFVVLVDGGSASASEILAGALQEHEVATIVGTQTFGKGSVQELVKLKDQSSLKVTVARWLTPNGVSISDGGLTPDIVVERTAEDRANERDTQLEAALEFLKK